MGSERLSTKRRRFNLYTEDLPAGNWLESSVGVNYTFPVQSNSLDGCTYQAPKEGNDMEGRMALRRTLLSALSAAVLVTLSLLASERSQSSAGAAAALCSPAPLSF